MTTDPDPDDVDLDRTAWSWVEHVRSGGSTPWASWSPPTAQVPRPPGRLPGAAQLEVARRLAGRRGSADIDFAALADLVLGRTGPGRGMGEIPLARQGSVRPVLGTPAIDPSDVPVEELVRVCIGVLFDLLTERPDPGPTSAPAPTRRPRRPWARGFRLAGSPVSTASLRASLAASGTLEGGRRPVAVIVAGTFDDMLREVWTARVQNGSGVRWSRFVGRWVREERLPVSVDIAGLAARWAGRVGAGRVHVVAPADDPGEVRRTVAAILGVKALPEPRPDAADVLPVPAPGVEVLRRLVAVLNVRVEPARHASLLRRAAGHLTGDGETTLVVPDRYAEWARLRAERMHEELGSGGYAVHGDLPRIVSRRTSESRGSVRMGDVLDLALGACLRAAER